MSLQDAIGVLRRYWRSLVVVTLLVGALGGLWMMRQTPRYTAAATVHFLPKASAAPSC